MVQGMLPGMRLVFVVAHACTMQSAMFLPMGIGGDIFSVGFLLLPPQLDVSLMVSSWCDGHLYQTCLKLWVPPSDETAPPPLPGVGVGPLWVGRLSFQAVDCLSVTLLLPFCPAAILLPVTAQDESSAGQQWVLHFPFCPPPPSPLWVDPRPVPECRLPLPPWY